MSRSPSPALPAQDWFTEKNAEVSQFAGTLLGFALEERLPSALDFDANTPTVHLLTHIAHETYPGLEAPVLRASAQNFATAFRLLGDPESACRTWDLRRLLLMLSREWHRRTGCPHAKTQAQVSEGGRLIEFNRDLLVRFVRWAETDLTREDLERASNRAEMLMTTRLWSDAADAMTKTLSRYRPDLWSAYAEPGSLALSNARRNLPDSFADAALSYAACSLLLIGLTHPDFIQALYQPFAPLLPLHEVRQLPL